MWPLSFKIELPRLSHTALVTTLAPSVPGGVLVAAYLFAHESFRASVFSYSAIGYKTTIGLLIVITYAVGVLFSTLIKALTGGLGAVIRVLMFDRGEKSYHPEPWKDAGWRRLASKFLGVELAPTTDELFFQEVFDKAIADTENIKDPEQRIQHVTWVHNYFTPLRKADFAWYWWYETLQAYFPSAERPQPYTVLVALLHEATWALVVAVLANWIRCWSVLAWALPIALLSFLAITFGSGLYGPDQWGSQLKAQMLRELRKREPQQKE